MLEINALGRLKMLFQRPYILKSSGGACPRTTLAARSFGACDWPPPPPPINLTLLWHFFQSLVSYVNIPPHPTVSTSTYEPLLGTSLQHELFMSFSVEPYTIPAIITFPQWQLFYFWNREMDKISTFITLYTIMHTTICWGKTKKNENNIFSCNTTMPHQK